MAVGVYSSILAFVDERLHPVACRCISTFLESGSAWPFDVPYYRVVLVMTMNEFLLMTATSSQQLDA